MRVHKNLPAMKTKLAHYGLFGIANYIHLDEYYREEILNITDYIYGYACNDAARRPINFYLDALPGSGKSFLVKQICKSLELRLGNDSIDYLYCNLTTIKSVADLYLFFRKGQTANIDGKLPVIFFDELDSGMPDKADAYPYFLMPMFDGKYYSDGQIHSLGRVVLFFAGSKKISEIVLEGLDIEVKKLDYSTIGNNVGLKINPHVQLALLEQNDNNLSYEYDEGEMSVEDWIIKQETRLIDTIKIKKTCTNDNACPVKILDFVDRIDKFIFVPPLNSRPNNNEKHVTSQADYIVIAMLNKHHKWALYVDKCVVIFLRGLLINDCKMRSVESLIVRSTTSNDGFFRLENLPAECSVKYEAELNNTKNSVFESIKATEAKGKLATRWFKIV
jgi:hypothetical protein